MSYTIEVMSDRPVVVQTLGKDFSQAKESLTALEQVTRLLDQQVQPVFFIWNIGEASFSLDDVITGANLVTQQFKLLKHPNIREAIIITNNRMMEIASKGLDSPIFGNVKLRVFKTLGEALACTEQFAYR